MGRKKITQYTRYGTVLLSFVQATGIALWLEKQTAPGGAPLVPHPGLGLPPDDGPDADDRHDLHHVARRADHRARHRQRHLAHHLRRDRGRPAAGDLRAVRPDPDGQPVDPHADLRARVHVRHRRADRLRRTRAAPDPRPVRQARRRPAGLRRAEHVPAAARQHGRRHPDHLRDLDHPDPVLLLQLHRRGLDEAGRELALAGAAALRPALRGRDPLLLLLLHVDRLQPDRHGRQHAQVRRVHPRHPAGPEDGRLHRHGPVAADDRRRGLPDLRGAAAGVPGERLQGAVDPGHRAAARRRSCRGSSPRASASTSTSAARRS